jgi:hypothetical protein
VPKQASGTDRASEQTPANLFSFGSVVVQPKGDGVPDQIVFLKNCVNAVNHSRELATASPSIMGELWTAASTGIENYQRDTDRSELSVGDQMRRAVVTLIAHRGRLCDLWLQHVTAYRLVKFLPHCRGCTNSAGLYEFQFNDEGIEPRLLEICPRCGFTRDQPHKLEFSVSVISQNVVRLDCAPIQDPWAAALTVQYQWPLPTRVWPWPADSAGRPALEQPLIESLQPVPVFVTVTMMAGTRLAMASRKMRGCDP